MNTALVIHGGAGTLLKSNMTSEKETEFHDLLKSSLESGNKILASGGSAEEAVTRSVEIMENSELFNAGKGSVFNASGKHEMDASIMTGHDLMAGAVSGVSGIKNPIILAKEVMLNSNHVMLSGEGAEKFAKTRQVKFETPDYFHSQYRHEQFLAVKDTNVSQLDHTPIPKKIDKFGTVGAVALDSHGNLAAATSTGGMTNKRYGRIGDSPIIGCGTYANNNTCAISCTGDGEYFIRGMAAYDVSCLIEYKNMTLQEACDHVIQDKMVKLGGEGGLIAVNRQGDIALPFNSAGMYRGYSQNLGEVKTFIYKD